MGRLAGTRREEMKSCTCRTTCEITPGYLRNWRRGGESHSPKPGVRKIAVERFAGMGLRRFLEKSGDCLLLRRARSVGLEFRRRSGALVSRSVSSQRTERWHANRRRAQRARSHTARAAGRAYCQCGEPTRMTTSAWRRCIAASVSKLHKRRRERQYSGH